MKNVYSNNCYHDVEGYATIILRCALAQALKVEMVRKSMWLGTFPSFNILNS